MREDESPEADALEQAERPLSEAPRRPQVPQEVPKADALEQQDRGGEVEGQQPPSEVPEADAQESGLG